MATNKDSLWQRLFGVKRERAMSSDTNALRTLGVDQARQLVKTHRGVLQLNSLSKITPTVAGILARYRGIVFLNGISSLSPTAAEQFAKHKGQIYLGGLVEMSEETREALLQNPAIHYPHREDDERIEENEC